MPRPKLAARFSCSRDHPRPSGPCASIRLPRSGSPHRPSMPSGARDWMKEPCASCPRRFEDFGGCRCQALALTGDARAADPVCHLSSHHALMADLAGERRTLHLPAPADRPHHRGCGMPRPDQRGPGGPGARSICGSRMAAARTIPTRISCGRPHRRRVFRPQQPKHLRRDGMRCLCGAALRGHSIVWLGERVSVWSPIARCDLAALRRRGCKCRGTL